MRWNTLPVGSNDAPRKTPIDGKDQNTRAKQHERHRNEPQKASFAERNDERTRKYGGKNSGQGVAGRGGGLIGRHSGSKLVRREQSVR